MNREDRLDNEDVEIEEADQDEATGDPGDAPAALPIRMLHDRVLVDPDDEAGERRSTGALAAPRTGPRAGSIQTIAPVGQRSIGSRRCAIA